MATSHLIKVALHRPVELTARGGHANGARYLGAQHNLPDNEFHQLVETLTAMIIQSLM